MKLIKEVDIINNKKAVVLLNLAAIPLVFLFGYLFQAIAFANKSIPTSLEIKVSTLFAIVIILFLSIILHELIHALFFKIFNWSGNVKFGFKKGMAYATSPQSYYTKNKFSIITISPFVIITILLYFLLTLQILSPYQFILLASIHAAGCIGDFYWIFLIIKSPKGSLIEDTEKGINFYTDY